MEKRNTVMQDALRMVIIAIACFGGYLFSQTVVFGNELSTQTLIVGIACSFGVAVGLYFFQRKKERNKKNDDVIDS